VTHEGELSDRVAEAKRFVKTMAVLGDKLGPLLLQFPPGFKPGQRDLLEALLDACAPECKLAVEFRDPAWFEEAELELLREREVGLCLAEYPGMPHREIRTADLVYIRFVGDRRKITEDFSWVRHDCAEDLRWWEDLVKAFAGEKAEIYAYFNNHYSGHAPSTAKLYRDNLEKRFKWQP
jgi:uncharacterized protein YecE (DUF72 family)